jgi:hypothetical protein
MYVYVCMNECILLGYVYMDLCGSCKAILQALYYVSVYTLCMIYIRIYMCVCTHTRALLDILREASNVIYIYIYIYAYIYICIYTCVLMQIHLHTHAHMHTLTHTHTQPAEECSRGMKRDI